MPRFLICCPENSRIKLKDLKNLDNERNTLVRLFATIKIVHKQPIRYSFTAEAFAYLSDCFEEYDSIVNKKEKLDRVNIF